VKHPNTLGATPKFLAIAPGKLIPIGSDSLRSRDADPAPSNNVIHYRRREMKIIQLVLIQNSVSFTGVTKEQSEHFQVIKPDAR